MNKTNTARVRTLNYRGTDASMVGATEPVFPDLETQQNWTKFERMRALSTSLNWYNNTQDTKQSTEFLAQWLELSPKRAQLGQLIRKFGSPLPTYGWLARSATMGYKLNFHELRQLYTYLTNIITENTRTLSAQKQKPQVAKPNIQDRINEKIRECNGEIQGAFDEFIKAGCTGDPSLLKLLIQYNVPQVRVKELVNQLTPEIDELTQVLAGTDSQLVEGYSNFTKRQIKSMIWWLQKAQEQIMSYGTMKAANRKPATRKSQTPQKIVSKLKYMEKHEELKLESIDPTQILKATELWVYNVNRRKLGIYVADETQGSLWVKNSRIMGYSETRSVSKTLRKPAAQLAEVMKAGKPASKKWFDDLKTTAAVLNGRMTPEWLLLKAYK